MHLIILKAKIKGQYSLIHICTVQMLLLL